VISLYCYGPFLANWLDIVIQSFSVYGVIMDIVNITYKLSGTTNYIIFHIVVWTFMTVATGITFTLNQQPIRKPLKANVDEGQAIRATKGFTLPSIFNSIIIFLFAGVAGLHIG
jgi:hypothetical protein